MRCALGLLLILVQGLSFGCAQRPSDANGGASAQPAAGAESDSASSPDSNLGEGFLVWESNRSGDWKIWIRELAPSGARQLAPAGEASRQCCPHISPDGSRIAYLRSTEAQAGYARGGTAGALHVIHRDGSEDRLIAAAARSSWEHRAAVWRGDEELIYIRGDGATVLHDLRDDRATVLWQPPGEPSPGAAKTWLIDSTLRHAVSGEADFSAFHPPASGGGGDRAVGAISARTPRAGCQPYFSHDGRWGYWAAGAGGPLNKIDLATGAVSTILAKSDPRMPDGLGYAYFPMFSRDASLFAFAASRDEHDHFAADYEIFVAPSDPVSLELLGDPVRMTTDPATDRFPDVFLEPLALGRFRGEAPFEVQFQVPEPNRKLVWSFGDDASGTPAAAGSADRALHVYEDPGSYSVSARAAETETPLRGQVIVQPAQPPRATAVRLIREGRSVEVEFDEKIAAETPRIRFESGTGVAGWRLGDEKRSLVIEPARRIDGFDQLHLEGVRDRAQKPNSIEPLTLEIEPPLWPSDRRGLAFLWETGNAPNLVWDPRLEAERATIVTSTGAAFLGRHFDMVLDGGRFVASGADSEAIAAECRGTNELSLEVVVTPKPSTEPGLRRIVSFSGGTPQSRNFLIGQRGERLVFAIRDTRPGADGTIEIVDLPAAVTSHVLISYRIGWLTVHVDGELVLATDSIQGGCFQWKARPLLFGSGPREGETWSGRLEGVAVYSRFIESREARENFRRYASELAQRPEVDRLVVEATLTARSRTPSLEQITPYREALTVLEYRVERLIEGSTPAENLRVAHWSILDGRSLEIQRRPAIGDRVRLTLEPFQRHPELAGVYLADTLEDAGAPLFYSIRP